MNVATLHDKPALSNGDDLPKPGVERLNGHCEQKWGEDAGLSYQPGGGYPFERAHKQMPGLMCATSTATEM